MTLFSLYSMPFRQFNHVSFSAGFRAGKRAYLVGRPDRCRTFPVQRNVTCTDYPYYPVRCRHESNLHITVLETTFQIFLNNTNFIFFFRTLFFLLLHTSTPYNAINKLIIRTDRQTDRPTDGPTNGRTDPYIELRVRD